MISTFNMYSESDCITLLPLLSFYFRFVLFKFFACFHSCTPQFPLTVHTQKHHVKILSPYSKDDAFTLSLHISSCSYPSIATSRFLSHSWWNLKILHSLRWSDLSWCLCPDFQLLGSLHHLVFKTASTIPDPRPGKSSSRNSNRCLFNSLSYSQGCHFIFPPAAS